MAHEFIILEFPFWPCVERHFGQELLEWRGFGRETFATEINVQKFAHLYQVLAMFVTERSMFVAERSRNLKVQNSKPEIRNKKFEFGGRKFAKWESRVSKCSLARENALKMQVLRNFRENLAAPPAPAILRRGEGPG